MVMPWCPWLLLVSLTAVTAILVVWLVIWPGYVNPNSRMYSSQLGYAALLRQQQRPFPVESCHPQMRSLTQHYAGEGLIRSAPILVPLIPASRIEKVCVQEGDHVRRGQLLVHLDATHAQLRLDAARVMLEVARAELERTRIGSAYLLEKERPEQDRIRVAAAEDQAKVQDELNRMSASLFEKGVISRSELLEQRLSLIQILASLRQAETSLRQSQLGRQQSVRIAEAAVREAELAVSQRELELAEHDVYAPADGIIERCLVHEGEYNQDPGKPAFLLASGQWFEAYFDQTVTGQLAVGAPSSIRLEAYPGVELTGKVTAIHPFVAFSASGPETTRPIRPSGTGSPEWPQTFSVRIELDGHQLPIYTGLSGFAKIIRDRHVLSVPSSAILSASSGKALVLVRTGDSFQSRHISLGTRQGGWVEVTEGLMASDEVLIEGHQVLQPGDRIKIANSVCPESTST
jgi:multidrug resistance efflux pump